MPRRKREPLSGARLKELQQEAGESGYSVRTWSPGDGVTRYRFFSHKELARLKIPQGRQTYSGPANGECTALGLKSAWKFLNTGKCPRGRR